ncbi:MAG: hypothetical protein IIY94_04540 [Oscillospiraceae bacterium]|nr:hypothetical protein [Oscillospiraceae bacterium]
MLLTVIEAQINSLLPEENQKEIEKLTDLYRYFSENKDALLDPYKRGIEIPETYLSELCRNMLRGSSNNF